MAVALGWSSEGHGFESWPWRLHFDGVEMLRHIYCAISVHIKEPQVVEISEAYHYVSHNDIMVLGSLTPEISPSQQFIERK